MRKCDCNERMGVKINSWQQFEELKNFFEEQVKKRVFVEIPVERPYYIGYYIHNREDFLCIKKSKLSLQRFMAIEIKIFLYPVVIENWDL